MQFGDIKRFILFGGGPRLLRFMEVARGFSSFVVSAPRLIEAPLKDGRTVSEHLTELEVPFVNIEKLSAFDLNAHVDQHTLGVSFGAPWIFKKEFIDQFGGRLINGHGTRLPKNRGGASFSWQIMRGDRTGACLFHLIDGGIDTGAIVQKEDYTFPESCRTPQDYKSHHEQVEVAFFETFLRRLAVNFDFPLTLQDETQSTYFPRLSTRHHGWIDWSWSVDDLERFICAYDSPHDGGSTLWRGQRVFLRGATSTIEESSFHPFMSGLVYRTLPGSIFVAAKDGAIVVHDLKNENGESLLGSVRVGDRFQTPARELDAAREFKAVYTPGGLKPPGVIG